MCSAFFGVFILFYFYVVFFFLDHLSVRVVCLWVVDPPPHLAPHIVIHRPFPLSPSLRTCPSSVRKVLKWWTVSCGALAWSSSLRTGGSWRWTTSELSACTVRKKKTKRVVCAIFLLDSSIQCACLLHCLPSSPPIPLFSFCFQWLHWFLLSSNTLLLLLLLLTQGVTCPWVPTTAVTVTAGPA